MSLRIKIYFSRFPSGEANLGNLSLNDWCTRDDPMGNEHLEAVILANRPAGCSPLTGAATARLHQEKPQVVRPLAAVQERVRVRWYGSWYSAPVPCSKSSIARAFERTVPPLLSWRELCHFPPLLAQRYRRAVLVSGLHPIRR